MRKCPFTLYSGKTSYGTPIPWQPGTETSFSDRMTDMDVLFYVARSLHDGEEWLSEVCARLYHDHTRANDVLSRYGAPDEKTAEYRNTAIFVGLGKSTAETTLQRVHQDGLFVSITYEEDVIKPWKIVFETPNFLHHDRTHFPRNELHRTVFECTQYPNSFWLKNICAQMTRSLWMDADRAYEEWVLYLEHIKPTVKQFNWFGKPCFDLSKVISSYWSGTSIYYERRRLAFDRMTTVSEIKTLGSKPIKISV